MPLVVANTYQLTINGVIDSDRPWANVFHVTPLGAGAPTVQEAALAMLDDCYPELMFHMQNTLVAVSCSYVDLSSTTGDSGTLTSTQPQGQGGGAAVPPNLSVLVRWSATGGRSQRSGRSYLPGLDESSIDSKGVINAPTVTNWQTDVDNFMAAVQTANLALGIVSKSSPTTGIFRTVLDGSVQNRGATQRRRLRS